MSTDCTAPKWEPLDGFIAASLDLPENAEFALIEGYDCRTWLSGGVHHFVVLKKASTIAKGSRGVDGSLNCDPWPKAGWWWGSEPDSLHLLSRLRGRALMRAMCEIAVLNELSQRTCRVREGLAARIAEQVGDEAAST